MKKLILLIILLFSALLFSVSVSALELTCGKLEGIAIQDGHIPLSKNEENFPAFYYRIRNIIPNNEKSLDDYKDAVLELWNNYSSDKIDISDVGITVQDVNKLQVFYSNLLDENPKYFYVKSHLNYFFDKNTGIIHLIQPIYIFDVESIPELINNFNSAVNTALSIIDESMSQIDKMIALHDYIVLNAEYDLETFENKNNNHPTSFTAYGVLVEHTGVCQSYALAYNLLLNEIGIDVDTVLSYSLSHVWNLVKIDNNWFHVDLTWDDPTPDKKGLVSYKYFLASDAEFMNPNNPHSSNDWITDYIAELDTFRNAFWKKSYSPITLYNQHYYYSDGNGDTVNLLRSNISDLENKEILRTISGLKWKYQDKSVSGGQFRVVPFLFDGNIYYNTVDSIYRYCPEKNEDEVVHIANIEQGFIVPLQVNNTERTLEYVHASLISTSPQTYLLSSPNYANLDLDNSQEIDEYHLTFVTILKMIQAKKNAN